MHARSVLHGCALVALFSLTTLSAQTSTLSTVSVARDPQAINVLTQALIASGGATTTSAILDFKASGSITYFWAGTEDQGTATIRALGLANFRLDATLAEGVRSWAATVNSASIKDANGQVTPILWKNATHLGALTLPQWKVASVLNDSTFTVQYFGTDNFSGHQVNIIHVQQPTNTSTDPDGILSHISAIDFLVDSATYQVVAIRDALHPSDDSMQDIRHDIAFADFRIVNGLLVPFRITETVAGQETWTLQVSTIAFNTGLTNADFQL